MHFKAIAVILPFLATLAAASPVPGGHVPPAGSVSIEGPADLPANCYYPHGVEKHELICTYEDEHPGAYPEVDSTVPDSCQPDDEEGADVVCYLPGAPDVGKRDALPVVQDAYKFRLWCDRTGCHTSGLPWSKRDAAADAAVAAMQEAYHFSIRIRWKRDLSEMIAKREAAKQDAYRFSIRIRW